MASILDTYIALDLETTGLNPQEAEIIAIGAVRVEDNEITDRFHTFVKPRMGIPEESTRLTGITDKDVLKAPRIESVLETLLTFFQRASHHCPSGPLRSPIPIGLFGPSFWRQYPQCPGPGPDRSSPTV